MADIHGADAGASIFAAANGVTGPPEPDAGPSQPTHPSSAPPKSAPASRSTTGTATSVRSSDREGSNCEPSPQVRDVHKVFENRLNSQRVWFDQSVLADLEGQETNVVTALLTFAEAQTDLQFKVRFHVLMETEAAVTQPRPIRPELGPQRNSRVECLR